MYITIHGPDSLVVAQAANTLPQILDPSIGTWRPAKTISEARRCSDTEPQTVRLAGDPRVMLEDITKESIPLGADLKAFISSHNNAPPLNLIGALL